MNVDVTNKCPYCGSEEIDYSEEEWFAVTNIENRHVCCADCGKKYTVVEEYTPIRSHIIEGWQSKKEFEEE